MKGPNGLCSKDVLEDWKKNRDPIHNYKKLLMDQGLLDEEKDTEIENQIDQEIAEAIENAEKSSLPKPERITEGLFA